MLLERIHDESVDRTVAVIRNQRTQLLAVRLRGHVVAASPWVVLHVRVDASAGFAVRVATREPHPTLMLKFADTLQEEVMLRMVAVSVVAVPHYTPQSRGGTSES